MQSTTHVPMSTQVEDYSKMTVADIFEAEGEDAFREVETAVLQVRRQVDHSCISGPGAVFLQE